MAAMQHGNVSAYGHGHSQIAPEDVASSLAGSGAAYEIPGGESDLQQTMLREWAFGSDPNAPMRRFVVQTMPQKWALGKDLDAPSSGGAGKGDVYGRFHLLESRRLADALAELAEVDDEIAEENLPQVGETTKAEAERLVRALTQCAPARALLAVYPTQDAEIALHFKAPGRPGAVLVLLRDDGRADCHAYIGGRSRRAHYGTSSELPDAFVLDQLRHLAPTPESRRLADALAELAEVDDEIAEENLPQVGETTKAEAERLVRALTQCAPARALLAVYPTQDAEIALHFKAPGRPGAVLVLLRDDGRADCHAYIGGRSRRAHYGASSELPDAFVLDQLRHLAPTPVGVSTPGAGFSPSWTAFLSKNLPLPW